MEIRAGLECKVDDFFEKANRLISTSTARAEGTGKDAILRVGSTVASLVRSCD